MTFYDGTTALGTETLSNGIATLTTSSLARGTHSITGQYGENSNHNAAVSTPVSQVVNLASPAVTVTSSPNPSTYGAPVTFTATFPAAATGTVTFYDATTVLGTASLSGGIATSDGQFAWSGNVFDQGGVWRECQGSPVVSTPLSHVVNPLSSTAALNVYGGDANHTAATSPPVSLTINSAVMADFNLTNQTPAQLIPPV